jgi:DNA polymerase III subunit epsilon
MGWDHLPTSVAFCDVETTGLGNHDRIVSFGGIGMISRHLTKGRADLEYLYLVFDPGMRNHRNAERIHGFSDSALRLQDPFAVHAADIWRFLTSYELLVAHNAAFDLRFINREMRLSGLPAFRTPVYCTMKGYRALHLGGSASLSAVCRHIKLARSGDLHDAIEDAWLAMQPALIQEPLISPSLRSNPSMTTSRKVHESLRDRIFGPQPCRLRSTTVSPAIKLASAGAHMGGGPTSKARKQLADFDLPTCEPMARNRLLGCSTTAAN